MVSAGDEYVESGGTADYAVVSAVGKLFVFTDATASGTWVPVAAMHTGSPADNCWTPSWTAPGSSKSSKARSASTPW